VKLTKIILTVLVTFTFSATVYADGDKLKVCEKAERTFWDTIAETHNSADQSFMGSLDEQVQVSYYKMALGKIEGSIVEVRKRCDGLASKDIVNAYEKKKSEIQDKLNAL